MAIDRKYFYEQVRAQKLFGKLKNSHVQGIDAVFDEWDRQPNLKDLRWLAYMLATDYHETAKTMQAIEEYGKGKGRPYGKKIKHSGISYKTPNKLYYGRGLVQLTWYENYELMGRLIGIDMLNNPDLALQLDVSVKIMFEGMLRGASSVGDFTGKCLEMYFNNNTEDWRNARRIINGTDKAELIADYGKRFFACLRVAVPILSVSP